MIHLGVLLNLESTINPQDIHPLLCMTSATEPSSSPKLSFHLFVITYDVLEDITTVPVVKVSLTSQNIRLTRLLFFFLNSLSKQTKQSSFYSEKLNKFTVKKLVQRALPKDTTLLLKYFLGGLFILFCFGYGGKEMSFNSNSSDWCHLNILVTMLLATEMCVCMLLPNTRVGGVRGYSQNCFAQ